MAQNMPRFVLIVGLLVGLSTAAYEEPLDYISPNPFVLIKPEKQGKGAFMRHPFHKMRVTWDNYFKVWDKPREGHQQVTLDEVLTNPVFFIDRKIEFDFIMNGRGNFFRQFVSPFHRDSHVNFNGWPDGAEIWNREKRVGIFPFLYVDKRDEKLIQQLEQLGRYAPVRLWGNVSIVSEEYPWIEVTSVELRKNEPRHTLVALRDLELAYQRMENKDWWLAETQFNAVLNKDLPLATAIKVMHSIGVCRYEQHRFRGAREAFVEALTMRGNPREQLTEILKRDRSCLKTLILLSRIDLLLGHDQEGLEAAELALYIESSNALARAEKGLALAKLGNTNGGMAEVDAAIRLAKGGRLPEGHRNRAQIFMMLKQFDEAEKSFLEAETLRPNDVQYHMELAEMYLSLGQLEKARLEFENSTRLTPQFPEPFYRLAVTYKAMSEAAVQKNETAAAEQFKAQALENVEKAIKADPRFPAPHALKAELLHGGRGSTSSQSTNHDTDSGTTSWAQLEAQFEQAKNEGNWVVMEQLTRKQIELNPQRAELHLRLADIYAFKTQPDFAAAADTYQRALEINAELPEAWVGLLRSKRQMKDWSGALVAGLKAVQVAPRNGHAWSDLAFVQRHQGDWNAAVSAAKEARSLNQSVASEANLALALLDRANQEDAIEALAWAQKAHTKATGKEKIETATLLGASLVANDQALAAQEHFQSSAAAKQDDAWFQFWWGRCALKLEQYENARQAFANAKSLAERDTSGSKVMERISSEAQIGWQQANEHSAIKPEQVVTEVSTKAVDVNRTSESHE